MNDWELAMRTRQRRRSQRRAPSVKRTLSLSSRSKQRTSAILKIGTRIECDFRMIPKDPKAQEFTQPFAGWVRKRVKPNRYLVHFDDGTKSIQRLTPNDKDWRKIDPDWIPSALGLYKMQDDNVAAVANALFGLFRNVVPPSGRQDVAKALITLLHTVHDSPEHEAASALCSL